MAEVAGSSQPVDQLELSAEGLAAAEAEKDSVVEPATSGDKAHEADSAAASQGPPEGTGSEANQRGPAGKVGQSETELTGEEQAELRELASADREVRAHEQAHMATAGPYARGGPSYQYEEGPDGRQYAVGGEVGIDSSPVAGDPEASIDKAQQVRAAALAPATPSGQDMRVAAAAAQMAAQARLELAQQKRAQESAAASYGASSGMDAMGTLLDLVA